MSTQDKLPPLPIQDVSRDNLYGYTADQMRAYARAALAAQPRARKAADDFERECDAADELMRLLGLDPERCRTEGGAINMARVKSLLADAPAREAVALTEEQNGRQGAPVDAGSGGDVPALSAS